MKAIDQDQVLSIINDMKEAVRSDRNIDSRDSLDLLHDIRTLARSIKKDEMDAAIVEKVLRACSREESLKDFTPQLTLYFPDMAPVVQNQG